MNNPSGIKLVELLKKGSAAGLNYPKIVCKSQGIPLKFYLATKGYVAIILNDETATYLGKITAQGTLWLGSCSEQVTQAVIFILDFINQGGDLGIIGKDQGFCCFCSRTLTNDGSLEHGYGPICADKYGLPWQGFSSKGEQKIKASPSMKEQILAAAKENVARLEQELSEAKDRLNELLRENSNGQV